MAILFVVLLPVLAITQLPGGGGEAIILKGLNSKLSSQVEPIVFPPFGTTVTRKIMKNQLG